MNILYASNIIPVRCPGLFGPTVNIVNGRILKYRKNSRSLFQSNMCLSHSISVELEFDVYKYSKTERRLIYEVWRLTEINSRGGAMQKIFSCYWQKGSRVRTETGEQTYDWWQDRHVIHGKLKAKNCICTIKEIKYDFEASGYIIHSDTWTGIVAEWESGKIRSCEPAWKSRKFGCEFEFTGLSRKKAVDVLMNTGYFRSHRYEGGPLYKHVLLDRQGRKFEIVRDSSIKADRHETQVELVTSVLSFKKDIRMLENILDALKKAGGKVNSSCGMHVHVSAEDYEENGYMLRTLILWTAGYQPLFYKAFDVPKSRQSYCQICGSDFLNSLERERRDLSVNQVANIQYARFADRNSHYNKSRYQIINLHSFFQGKGIEIRLFNATLNANQAIANITFSCALVEYAGSSALVPNIDQISREEGREAMHFLLQEMDCRSLHLTKMVEKNM